MVAGTLTYDTKMDTKGLQKGVSSVKSIVAGLGITKIISSAFNVLTGSIDGAINRIDALNNFPNVMANLGIGAEESKEAIEDLSKRLQGIPTTLDDASIAVQRFTSKNGDVKKSVEIFDAVNNAILAGGANSQIQASALEQLSQAYAKGKPDMMEWRTLQMAMPAQLKQVAKAMGKTTDELGDGLRKGKISMDDFIETIIKLNKEGTGEFKAFSEQARNSTGGIKTSITNAKTAVVRGVAGIVTAINETMINAGFGSIAENFSKIGKWAEQGLKFVSDKIKEYAPIIINKVTDIVRRVREWIQKVNLKQTIKNTWEIIKNFAKQVVNAIKPIYNFIKNNIIPIITKMFQAFSKDKLETKSFEKFNKLLKDLQPILAAVLAGFIAFKSVLILKSIFTAVGGAFKSFTSLLVTNPFAIVIAAITMLVVGLTSLAKSMDTTTSKLKAQVAETSAEMTSHIGKMGDAYSEFGQKIDSAESNLDAFNTRLFMTDSEQQKMQDDLVDIQNKITEITSRAHEERRDLTQAEIDKINEYLDKMQEIKKRLADFDLERQSSIRDQAKAELETFSGTEAEYEEMMTRWQKTSSDAAKESIKAVRDSATEQLAYLNATYTTDEERQSDAYKTKKANIEKWRDDSIKTIQETNAETISLFSERYDKEVQADAESFKQLGELMEKRKKAQNDLNEATSKSAQWNLLDGKYWTGEYYKMANQSRADLTNVQKQITAMFDEQGIRRIGIWVKEQEQFVSTGGKMSEDNAQIARDIIEAYDKMDEETQAKMKDMVEGLKETLSKSGEPLANKTKTVAEKMAERFSILVPKGKEHTSSFMKGIKDEVETHKPSIKDAVVGVKDDAMVGPFANIKSDGETAGSDYGQGLLNGLNSKWSAISNAAKSIGSLVNSSTRQGMDAHSPSKKAYKTGLDYIAGLRNALKDGENDVYAVAEDIGDTMVTELSKAVNIESGKTMAKATLNSNINKSFVFNASFNGNVELDNKKVGRILAPNVSKALKVGGL